MSSHAGKNATIDKQYASRGPPGHAKIELQSKNGETNVGKGPHPGRPKSRSRVGESSISKILQNNMIFRKSQKSRSRAGEKAKMEKGWGDGAPPGEAKIALSCRRELNFEDIAKQQDFLNYTLRTYSPPVSEGILGGTYPRR